jgi:hypothetical protein
MRIVIHRVQLVPLYCHHLSPFFSASFCLINFKADLLDIQFFGLYVFLAVLFLVAFAFAVLLFS